jgi:beta-lactam-binding protein with PASTA domain
MQVSSGPSSVVIPSTIGLTPQAAKATLTAAGFVVTVSNCLQIDIVSSQSPAGGEAPSGSPVIIGC